MSNTWELKVSFAPLKHCFVSVPKRVADSLVAQGSSEVVLRLSTVDWQSNTRVSLLVAWDGSTSSADDLRVSPHLWSALRADSVVEVSCVPTPRSSAVLCVEPRSSDDWEVLELNAGYLEEQILSQLFVVSLGQVFPLWIYGKQLVVLCVKSIDCGESGVLRPNTSFVVEPKVRRTKKSANNPSLEKGPLVIRSVELRVLPADWVPGLAEGTAAAACDDWRDGCLISVTNVCFTNQLQQQQQQQQQQHQQQQQQQPDDGDSGGGASASRNLLVADRVVLRASRMAAVPRGCVAIRPETMMALQLRPYARVLVTGVSQSPSPSPEHVRLLVFSRKRVPVAKFWEVLCKKDGLVMNDGCMVQLEPGLMARVEIEKCEDGFVLASSAAKAELVLR